LQAQGTEKGSFQGVGSLLQQSHYVRIHVDAKRRRTVAPIICTRFAIYISLLCCCFCSQNVGTPFKTQPDREFEANLNSVSASSAKKPRLDYNKDN
jgi:hypothetical protein